VHNPETSESFWKIPTAEIADAVQKFEQLEKEVDEADVAAKEQEQIELQEQAIRGTKRPIEEVEEEEEEEEEEESDDGFSDDENNPLKRQRIDGGPQEFGEDDIAYQLAAEEGYDFEEDDELEEASLAKEEEAKLAEEAQSEFKAMLEDYKISPYTTWERVIEEGKIIEDDRYLLLPNMKSRRAVWDNWSAAEIKELKLQKAVTEKKKDPLAEYMSLLAISATPKLYYPEFKRKHRKHAGFTSAKVTEKDREKAYRSFVALKKGPSSEQRAQFIKLLKGLPSGVLHRDIEIGAAGKDGSVGDLPRQLWSDAKFWLVDDSQRLSLLSTFLAEQPTLSELDPSIQEHNRKADKTAQALREREKQVQFERERAALELRRGKGELDAHQRDIKNAMSVGKDGLLSHLQPSP
jgi:hypothetical protein